MELLSVYGCSYCSMVSRRKGSVVRHESHHCRKSPNRETCLNCKNMSFEQGDNHLVWDEPFEPSSWYCLKKDEDLQNVNLNANIKCSFYERIDND